MSLDSAGYAAIKNRVATQWAATAWSSVPIYYRNERFELPDEPTPFIVIEVLTYYEKLAAFGGGRGANEWEDQGSIFVRVFVPVDQGEETAMAIRDAISTIFRGQRFDNVSCFGVVPAGGDSKADDGNYYEVAAVVEFSYRFTG